MSWTKTAILQEQIRLLSAAWSEGAAHFDVGGHIGQNPFDDMDGQEPMEESLRRALSAMWDKGFQYARAEMLSARSATEDHKRLLQRELDALTKDPKLANVIEGEPQASRMRDLAQRRRSTRHWRSC